MSEPMSQHEIEDVLSSIRRLVSEDLKPMVRSTPRRAEGEAAPPAPEVTPLRLGDAGAQPAGAPLRLRLTPLQEKAEKPAPMPLVLTPALRVEEETPTEPREEVVARLGAALSSDPQEWEQPFGEAEDLPPADLSFRAQAEVQAPSEAEADEMAAPMAVDVIDEAPADIADWQPEPLAQGDEPPPIVEDAETIGDDWADAAEAAALEDIARATAEAVQDQVQDHSGGMTFDEEVLRDLVRDILREELAGSLGERITRNVRKLVRAEIARAMAVRDFE